LERRVRFYFFFFVAFFAVVFFFFAGIVESPPSHSKFKLAAQTSLDSYNDTQYIVVVESVKMAREKIHPRG